MEIFHTHYRLNRDEAARTGPFVRWLGGSIIAHALLIAAMVYVPAVRDTFALASTLSAFQVVDEGYTKTEVHERATIINLAANQLYYPYDLQNPPVPDPALVETVAPTPMPVVRAPRPRRPRATPTPSPEATPEVAENAGDPQASPSPGATPAEPQSVAEAEKIMKDSGVEKFKKINVRPFTDLVAQAKKMRDEGQLDLSGTLEMTVEADREENGKLTNVVVTPVSASDPKLKELAKEFVAALSDSMVLDALKGTRHLVMNVKLDQQAVSVRVVTEVPSEQHARIMSLGYSAALYAGKKSKEGQDEERIFDSVKVTSEANKIVLNFNMARKDAGDLITKLLKKNEAPAPTPAT